MASFATEYVKNITKKFAIEGELGEGGFSHVYKATEKETSEDFALKKILKKDILKSRLEREIVVMRKLDKRIPIAGKSNVTEIQAANIIAQILHAAAYLHDREIIHRDLKLENVICCSDSDMPEVKIVDFNLARFVELEERNMTMCGSPEYVSPEILELSPYGTKTDMWQIGVIAYVLLGGALPFEEEHLSDLFAKIVTGEYYRDVAEGVSEEFRFFVGKLIEVDQSKRYSAKEALEDSWMIMNTKCFQKHFVS